MPVHKDEIVGGVIVNRNKVLIARRMEGDEDEFLWEFPGGRIECDETPEFALQRELREELGLDIEVKGKICELNTGERMFYFYFAISKNDIDRLSSHQEIKWVNIQELSDFKFCEPDQEVLAKIIQYLKGVKIC